MSEKKKKRFTPEQLKRIKKVWVKNGPPKNCIGECNIDANYLIPICTSCGWNQRDQNTELASS